MHSKMPHWPLHKGDSACPLRRSLGSFYLSHLRSDANGDPSAAAAVISSLLDSLENERAQGRGSRPPEIGRRLQSSFLYFHTTDLHHIGINLEELMIMEAMRRSMAEATVQETTREAEPQEDTADSL